MSVCPRCGRESPEEFEFCPGCGAALTVAPAPRQVRKVVTVLFCDLTGSTAIGDKTDPEPLRALMTRYYDGARAVLERHGGTVEKFVGDAVMSVFGIPVSTENDALRAVRAAVELRESVHGLGLEARIGVNTGEVVAGAGDTLVTGDAVNVTARLEQAAGPGEVLLGDETLRLVRDAVETEVVELTVKGKPEPLVAHRLLGLDAAAAGLTRHLERPMVGRERERERLRADFADAAAAHTCRLFTLIGPAGVGKSRLVADFVEHVGEAATVARCRALSYGEGITYWPLVELLVQLGLDPDEAIRSSPGDTQLATRALLERVAEKRPLVLVLDDLQWAEPPLLDLVEHVVDWSREAPIFLLCVARPELLDHRTGWGGGKVNATSILLEPLGKAEAVELADLLLEGIELDGEIRSRILDTAEGNPLFIEEMAALARESRGIADVPPTIQAVLQARLDTLSEHERTVIERGAVEGKLFHRGAVTALAPAPMREHVAAQLLALVRKELVRPDRAQVAGDDAFRFRHLLIRDTAYEGLPKAVRAELHERFADWLDTHANLVEQDEIVGYHLEQASLYRAELDTDDPRSGELGRHAAVHLGDAGRAAFEREDVHAARNLLKRAIALLPAGEARRRLLPDLVDVLGESGASELSLALALIEELAGGDERDRAEAVALRALWHPTGAFVEPAERLAAAQQVLAAAGDVVGQARCERARGFIAWSQCRAGEAHAAYCRARELLLRAGSMAFRNELSGSVSRTAMFAGLAVADVRRILDELHEDAEEDGPLRAATARAARARLDFQAGSIGPDELRLAIDEQVRLNLQTGSELRAFWADGFSDVAAWVVHDDEGVERIRRENVRKAESFAEHYLANALGGWALSLCRLGDVEGASRAIARGRELAHAQDVADQIVLDLAEANVLALKGESEAPLELLQRVRERAEGIDMAFVAYESTTLPRTSSRPLATSRGHTRSSRASPIVRKRGACIVSQRATDETSSSCADLPRAPRGAE